MSLASKLSAGLLAAACVCQLAAAEVLTINEPADVVNTQLKQPTKTVVKTDDGMSVKGQYFVLFSAKTLTMDPAKKYKISGEFRLKEGVETGLAYLGFAPFDADGKLISPVSVNIVPKTYTVVAKAAAAGDSVIYVKDASKWKTNDAHYHVVFDAKEDLSDLPNRNYASIVKDGIKQDGDVWAITLKAPLKDAIAEGTSVRQHRSGSSYIYVKTSKDVNPENWTSVSGTISGAVSEHGLYGGKLWHGTATVRALVMMLNGKKGNVIEVRNIKVEELE